MGTENKKGQFISPRGNWPERYNEQWDYLLHRSFCNLDLDRVEAMPSTNSPAQVDIERSVEIEP